MRLFRRSIEMRLLLWVRSFGMLPVSLLSCSQSTRSAGRSPKPGGIVPVSWFCSSLICQFRRDPTFTSQSGMVPDSCERVSLQPGSSALAMTRLIEAEVELF